MSATSDRVPPVIGSPAAGLIQLGSADAAACDGDACAVPAVAEEATQAR